VLLRSGRRIEAERAFGKAAWDATWSGAAGFALAQSLSWRGEHRSALRVLDELDQVAGHDVRRAALRAIVLRRTGRDADADAVLTAARAVDPLDALLRILAGEPVTDPGVLLDAALDLRDAGSGDEALTLLARVSTEPRGIGSAHGAMAHYISAQILDLRGDGSGAESHRNAARAADLDRVFPYGLDAWDALRAAMEADPADHVAYRLAGMLLYAHRRHGEAASAWERAVELGGADPVLLRCAGLAAYNVDHDDARAWDLYERAVAAAPDDARLRFEQDQLASRLGHTPSTRLARLSAVEEIALSRDDLTIEYVRLLVSDRRADRAHQILLSRSFAPWEGGEGQAIAAWDAVCDALALPRADPPVTLGEARSSFTPPAARRDDGSTDYFATSLPDLLLFSRQNSSVLGRGPSIRP